MLNHLLHCFTLLVLTAPARVLADGSVESSSSNQVVTGGSSSVSSSSSSSQQDVSVQVSGQAAGVSVSPQVFSSATTITLSPSQSVDIPSAVTETLSVPSLSLVPVNSDGTVMTLPALSIPTLTIATDASNIVASSGGTTTYTSGIYVVTSYWGAVSYGGTTFSTAFSTGFSTGYTYQSPTTSYAFSAGASAGVNPTQIASIVQSVIGNAL